MESRFRKFWEWYERRYVFNVGIAAVLFAWQLFHLYWLSVDVVAMRLVGHSYWDLSGLWIYLMVLVDYTEVPAIIGVSLIYINELRKVFNWKSVLFLFFLNSQWLHIFWITDEFVIEQLAAGSAGGRILPLWLAWLAIAIDYLELPVIFDTIRIALKRVRERISSSISAGYGPER